MKNVENDVSLSKALENSRLCKTCSRKIEDFLNFKKASRNSLLILSASNLSTSLSTEEEVQAGSCKRLQNFSPVRQPSKRVNTGVGLSVSKIANSATLPSSSHVSSVHLVSQKFVSSKQQRCLSSQQNTSLLSGESPSSISTNYTTSILGRQDISTNTLTSPSGNSPPPISLISTSTTLINEQLRPLVLPISSSFISGKSHLCTTIIGRQPRLLAPRPSCTCINTQTSTIGTSSLSNTPSPLPIAFIYNSTKAAKNLQSEESTPTAVSTGKPTN